MFSAVTNRGNLSFMVFKERFRTPVFVNFLRRLVRLNRSRGRGKTFLIVDSHPVHKSIRVTRWVAKRRSAARVVVPAGVQPGVEPGRVVEQRCQEQRFGPAAPATQQQMMHLTRTYLHSTQRQPDIVRNYFREENVRYAAN